MKKIPLVLGLMLMASAVVAAQNASASYRFDVPGLSALPSDFYTRRFPDDS